MTDFTDMIDEALYDAICDGEGRARADHLIHHLAKRNMRIVLDVADEDDEEITGMMEG